MKIHESRDRSTKNRRADVDSSVYFQALVFQIPPEVNGVFGMFLGSSHTSSPGRSLEA